MKFAYLLTLKTALTPIFRWKHIQNLSGNLKQNIDFQSNIYQQQQTNSTYDKSPVIPYDQDVNTQPDHYHARGTLVEQYSEYDEDPYLEAQESIDSYIEEDSG